MNREEWTSFAAGILTGAAVGGAVALLFAPKSGAETRALIKEKAGEGVTILKEKAEEGVTSLKEGVATVKQRVRNKVCGDGEGEMEKEQV